ncbi:hypothetical protein LUTEI9C_50179 [Luteimonas sp. 9C]|nr:hypothetical protein LUTEI9C_50179 [Luteimonas sp. 9C]
MYQFWSLDAPAPSCRFGSSLHEGQAPDDSLISSPHLLQKHAISLFA